MSFYNLSRVVTLMILYFFSISFSFSADKLYLYLYKIKELNQQKGEIVTEQKKIFELIRESSTRSDQFMLTNVNHSDVLNSFSGIFSYPISHQKKNEKKSKNRMSFMRKSMRKSKKKLNNNNNLNYLKNILELKLNYTINTFIPTYRSEGVQVQVDFNNETHVLQEHDQNLLLNLLEQFKRPNLRKIVKKDLILLLNNIASTIPTQYQDTFFSINQDWQIQAIYTHQDRDRSQRHVVGVEYIDPEEYADEYLNQMVNFLGLRIISPEYINENNETTRHDFLLMIDSHVKYVDNPHRSQSDPGTNKQRQTHPRNRYYSEAITSNQYSDVTHPNGATCLEYSYISGEEAYDHIPTNPQSSSGATSFHSYNLNRSQPIDTSTRGTYDHIPTNPQAPSSATSFHSYNLNRSQPIDASTRGTYDHIPTNPQSPSSATSIDSYYQSIGDLTRGAYGHLHHPNPQSPSGARASIEMSYANFGLEDAASNLSLVRSNKKKRVKQIKTSKRSSLSNSHNSNVLNNNQPTVDSSREFTSVTTEEQDSDYEDMDQFTHSRNQNAQNMTSLRHHEEEKNEPGSQYINIYFKK